MVYQQLLQALHNLSGWAYQLSWGEISCNARVQKTPLGQQAYQGMAYQQLPVPAWLGIPLKLLGLQLWEASKTGGASSNDGHYNAGPDAPQLTCEICTH